MKTTTATARSPVSSSPPQKKYKSGHTNDAWQRSPESSIKAKGGKPHWHQPHHRRQNNNDHPKHNVPLHRLSMPSSPPSGTLLERIGGSVEDVDEVASNLTDSDWVIDGECVPFNQGADSYADLPFSTTPHAESGEVERFLESVIGATGVPPPLPSPPAGPGHARSGNRPTLALETRNLPVDHLVKVEDPSSSVLYSPTQTAVNSLPSANHCSQSPLLGDTMSSPSASAIEECRKRLVPVLLASAQARDTKKHLDVEQCLRLLSDDHCRLFFRQAKEMRRQLSSLVSQETPMKQGWSGSLKCDRADDMDTWVQNTHSRFNSVYAVVSDVSRRDSDITLVDFPGRRLPPKAPRAMLHAHRASLNKPLDPTLDDALIASPATEDRPASATSLTDLVHQAVKMFPALEPTSTSVTEIDTSSVPAVISTSEPPAHPSQEVSPTHPVSFAPASTDFVSHLPTQAGIWFRHQGRRHAEIVDVDIDVSDEVFYMSTERRPFRLRMHLRLCSLPVSAAVKNESDTPASLQDVTGLVDHHKRRWPKKGTLVVQVNPESERSKTWLPYILESDPLDVTSCMQPGKNTFRFIQLADLSEFTFVLAASPPPPEEEWRSWDWASIMERSLSGTGASTTDDRSAVNGLSEFARIPVTVRS